MITNSCKEIKLIQFFQRRRRRSCSSGSFLAGSSVVLSSVVSVVSSVVRLSGQPGIFQVSPERAAVVLPEATYPYSLQPEYTQIQIQNIEYTNTHVYKYKLPNTNTKSSIISVCVFFRRQLIRTLWRLCGTLRRRSNKLFAEIGCLSNGESPLPRGAQLPFLLHCWSRNLLEIQARKKNLFLGDLS